MAINKIPKNYYSDTNIRRDKINEIIDEVNDIASIPSPSAADAGKVIKVGSGGDYELGADEGLPAVSSADNGKLLQVRSGEWEITSKPDVRSILLTNTVGYITSTRNMGVYISYDGTTISRQIFGSDSLHSTLKSFVSNSTMLTMFNINGTIFVGFYCSTESNNIIFVAWNTDGSMFKITVSDSAINLKQISGLKYIDVTASSGVVTLPQDVTYADITALVEAGVNVQLRQALSSSYRYFHLSGYDETRGLFFENSYFGANELSLYEIHLDETVSEIRYKTITFDT